MKRKFIFVFSLLVVTFFCFSFAVDLLSNKPAIRAYCQNTREFIDTNPESLRLIFTSTFDRAKKCQGNTYCEAQVSESIFSSLHGLEGLEYKESTYFIRLHDGDTIEKLFLSGKYSNTRDSRAKESKVIALLKNTRGAICDDGWKIDANEHEEGLSGSRMRYLYDMFSEAEVIMPVYDGTRVLGAVVKAWGD